MFKNKKLNYLAKLLEIAKEKRRAVLLFGRYGIGKSSFVYQFAEYTAKKLNREFVIWHMLSYDEKLKVMDNPSKYFVLVDIKGSFINPEDLYIPVKDDKTGKIKWQVAMFVELFENEDAAGVLFIDELNMVQAPQLQGCLFEMLWQRKLKDRAMKAKELYVIGASNPTRYNPIAMPIPNPLKDRVYFVNFDYLISLDAWLEWAHSHGIDDRVIAYVLFKCGEPSEGKVAELWYDPPEEDFRPTTLRALELLSDAIKEASSKEELEFFARASLSPNIASEFIRFVECYDKLTNIEEFVRNPERLLLEPSEVRIVILYKLTKSLISKKLSSKDVIKLLEYLIDREKSEYAMMVLRLLVYNGKTDIAVDIAVNSTKVGALIDEFYEFLK